MPWRSISETPILNPYSPVRPRSRAVSSPETASCIGRLRSPACGAAEDPGRAHAGVWPVDLRYGGARKISYVQPDGIFGFQLLNLRSSPRRKSPNGTMPVVRENATADLAFAEAPRLRRDLPGRHPQEPLRHGQHAGALRGAERRAARDAAGGRSASGCWASRPRSSSRSIGPGSRRPRATCFWHGGRTWRAGSGFWWSSDFLIRLSTGEHLVVGR